MNSITSCCAKYLCCFSPEEDKVEYVNNFDQIIAQGPYGSNRTTSPSPPPTTDLPDRLLKEGSYQMGAPVSDLVKADEEPFQDVDLNTPKPASSDEES